MSGISYVHNYFPNIDEDVNAFVREASYHTPRPLKLMLYDINKTVYTGKTFQELGIPLQVSLLDEATGNIVNTGPESSLPVEILVLDKDFIQENWAMEEFNRFVIEASKDERKRTRSLLCDKPCLFLREGRANGISFRYTNKPVNKCEYRLGARIVDHDQSGVRVKEAKTNTFTLKDKRNMSKKIYPASLNHDVWRLENIRKDGPYHKRLSGLNINTVKDFLSEHSMDPVNLRDIVLMKSTKAWDATVQHAKTCVLCPEKYLYKCPNSKPRIGVVFNIVKEILGLYSEALGFVGIDQLTNGEKAFMRELMVCARAHAENVVRFDDGASLDCNIPRIRDPFQFEEDVGTSYGKQESSFESGIFTTLFDNKTYQFGPSFDLDPQDFLDNVLKEQKNYNALSS